MYCSFQAICKLFGGPSAAIMCVVVDTQEDCDYVYAGSKDHYIKASSKPNLKICIIIFLPITGKLLKRKLPK